MRRLGSLLKNELLTGLLLILPIVGAAWLVVWLATALDGLFPDSLRPSVRGLPLPGLGLVSVVLLAFLLGLLARNFVGRKLVALLDSGLQRIPLFGTPYGLIKQVLEAVFSTGGSSFTRAVLVPYPVAGSWAIGFVTQPLAPARLAQAAGAPVLSVYLPTTPNPTSGFYLLVEASAVRELDMPVEQAFKLLLTMGIADAEGLATTAKWTRPETDKGAKEKEQRADG